MDKIEYNFAHATPSRNYCSAHTLSNAGKQMIGPEGVAPHAEEFRKQWQKLIQHPGKARELSHTIFDEPLKNSRVFFYSKNEQIYQIAKHGVDMIVGDILPVCKEKKWLQLWK